MHEVEIETVTELVADPTTGRVTWVVVAAFVEGPQGDPVCVDYRVRQVRPSDGARNEERSALLNAQMLDARMRTHAADDEIAEIGTGPFSGKGIPRYVFDGSSQVQLIERVRRAVAAHDEGGDTRSPRVSFEGDSGLPSRVPPKSTREAFALPPKRAGRPPARSLEEKLRILSAVEKGYRGGKTLDAIAREFEMSRSSLRDLLTWARRDAVPRLFTGAGQGRKQGALTPEARELVKRFEEGNG